MIQEGRRSFVGQPCAWCVWAWLVRRYTQLRCERVEAQAAGALALAAQASCSGGSSSSSSRQAKQVSHASADAAAAGTAAAASGRGLRLRVPLPQGLHNHARLAVSGLLGLLIAGGRHGRVGRALQAASTLFLLHTQQRR